MTLTTLNLIALACGLLGAALAAAGCWRLRDTTIAAPCAWAVLSFVALAAAAAWAAHNAAMHGLASAHLQYLAGMTVVAPFVALLGAKRPQHIAWQWIVASLVVLLAFQDLRSWSIEGTAPAPHAAWQGLLSTLLVMQLANHLPTRYGVAAVLAGCGQFGVLASSCPLLSPAPRWSFAAGVIALSLAALLAAAVGSRRRQASDAWLDFRDLFGALWALRVCQRVNSVTAGQTRRQLSWSGIPPSCPSETLSAPQSASEVEPLQRSLRAVLARFVSAAWLSRRNAFGPSTGAPGLAVHGERRE